MSHWLYQMRANDNEPYRPEHYRAEVYEDRVVKWDTPGETINIDPRGQGMPGPGDKVIFFFCETGLQDEEEPGLYGLGEIQEFGNESSGRVLHFTPLPPNDELKKKPAWSPKIKQFINKIRGGFFQRTLWGITEPEYQEFLAEMHASL